MALVPDQKFSTFVNGGSLVDGDIIVGLREGLNTRFTWENPVGIESITGTANQVLVNGTSGTPVTGVITLTLPQDIGTSSSPTFAGLTLSSPLTIANGGTSKTSVTTIPAASSWAGWDAQSNLSADNFLTGFTTTVTAAGTTTLTVSSNGIQEFTGSTTQTVVMPVTSTLAVGTQYYIINNSSGVVTVQSSGANTIQAMAAGSALLLTCVLISGTTAASWQSSYIIDSGLAGAVLLNPTGAQTISTYGLTVPNLTTANLSFDVTANSILSTGTNAPIALTPNGTGGVCIGNSTSTHGTPGSLWIARDGFAPALGLSSYVASTSGCVEYFFKSRSTTQSAFATVNTGDTIGSLLYYGDDGTQFSPVASFIAQATGTVSTGIVPGMLVWATTNSSGVLTTGMTLTSAQVLNLANALPPDSGGTGTATPPSAGQIPIGTSGNVYTPAAINSGSGIVVANGSGSITVSATGGGVAWVSIAGTTQAAAVNTGYIVANASQTTITLPATAAIGDTIKVRGLGAAGWVLAANTGQTIKYITATTSSAGSLTSAEQYDNIEVTCIVANLTWTVAYAATTGLTVA